MRSRSLPFYKAGSRAPTPIANADQAGERGSGSSCAYIVCDIATYLSNCYALSLHENVPRLEREEASGWAGSETLVIWLTVPLRRRVRKRSPLESESVGEY